MPATTYKRTRIAPTPSGFLHLGNVLSFSITAALARRHDAKILLRIDDLDQARVNKNYLQDIFDTLNFLEIPWDEGPRNVKEFEQSYSQLHRMTIYNKVLEKLNNGGHVFACTCSRQQLRVGERCRCFEKNIPLNEPGASWRLITDNVELSVNDYSGKIIQDKLPADMYNFAVRKKDGFPSYQLTSVLDDIFYEVDLVVRGQDLWPSTLAQHLLTDSLGETKFQNIVFYHHPLLVDMSGEKLSKSAGATSIKYLRESGKSRADIYTFIAAMFGFDQQVTNWEQLSGLLFS